MKIRNKLREVVFGKPGLPSFLITRKSRSPERSEGEYEQGIYSKELVLPKVFGKTKKLGREIEEQVTRFMLPGTLAAYNTERSVSFGEISVSPQAVAINSGQKTITWNELGSVTLAGGYISLKRHGHLIAEHIPITHIPNACVFKALVEQIQAGQKA